MRSSWIRVAALLGAAAVALLTLRIPGLLKSLELTPSAWAAAFVYALVALVIVCLAWFAYKKFFAGPHEVAQFAQGFAAIVTIVALFVAAGIYFLERRDKPRLSLTLRVNAIRLPEVNGAPTQVLLVVHPAIRNEGDRKVVIQCSSLALEGVKEGQRPGRTGNSEELAFSRAADPINYQAGERCNTAEERRYKRGPVKPLYRWPLALHVEPGESGDRYFEMPIGCDFALLRVLAKFRIAPDDSLVYEIKDTISISKVCTGDREIATGLSALGAGEAGPEPAAGGTMAEPSAAGP